MGLGRKMNTTCFEYKGCIVEIRDLGIDHFSKKPYYGVFINDMTDLRHQGDSIESLKRRAKKLIDAGQSVREDSQ